MFSPDVILRRNPISVRSALDTGLLGSDLLSAVCSTITNKTLLLILEKEM